MIMTKKTLDQIIDNLPVTRYGWGIIDSPRVVLTGSCLLCLYGLLDEFEDIDIIIRGSKDIWSEILSSYDVETTEGYDHVKIEKGGFVYNLLKEDFYNEETLLDCNDEIELDTLQHAIDAKVKLDRRKDLKHFIYIQKRITDIINNK